MVYFFAAGYYNLTAQCVFIKTSQPSVVTNYTERSNIQLRSSQLAATRFFLLYVMTSRRILASTH
jgi:hypothetical protein